VPGNYLAHPSAEREAIHEDNYRDS
jgi:hypothetical protein